MKQFLKFGFYLFHPIWIPFLGALYFFLTVPAYFPINLVKAKLIATLLFSTAIPILFLGLLVHTKLTKDYQIEKPRAKRLFLMGNSMLLILLNRFIVSEISELVYFNSALILSYVLLFIGSVFRIKISMHTTALTALLVFVVGLSLLHQLPITITATILIFSLGWCTANRLEDNTQSFRGIFLGLIIGSLPQLYFIYIALQHYSM